MMLTLTATITALIIGFILGFWLNGRHKVAKESFELILDEKTLLAQHHANTQDQLQQAEKKLSEQTTRNEFLTEKLDNHTQQQQQLKDQFEAVSHKLLNQQTEKLTETSSKRLNELLNPFKDQLKELHQHVDKSYHQEAQQRVVLQKEIERIVTVNQQMSEDAQNLAKALKGDNKLQGNWGELVLERVLKTSGLREGEEYLIQGKDLKLKNELGQHCKPDVIIWLPDQKHLIVDSKVSLTQYQQMLNCTDEHEAQKHQRLHLQSVRQHIDDLSGKKYDLIETMNSPDFVLLFMPIESAFAVALQSDPKLFQYAWDKRIIIVSPTTLLATLRTVASLWQIERQNQNAQNIAKKSGALYDKFVGFVKDIDELGRSLNRNQVLYDQALNKLSTGNGNLIRRAEHIRELGAKTTKQLPEKWLSETETTTIESIKEEDSK